MEEKMTPVRHQTFSRTHATNTTGKAGLEVSADLRREAEEFIEKELGESEIVAISESRDQLASSVTVWYRSGA
jgi:hypothetical protein